jgi:cytochrome c2
MASKMKLPHPYASLWLSALAAMAAASCATTPASPPASTPAEAAPAAPAAPAARPAAAVERPAAFAVCGACHGTAADAAPSLGPNLFGVAGKPAGTAHPDFDYSAALKASGKVWTPENLAAFLQDPAGFIPGNNMDYPGVSDEATAKSIADYMASLH